MTVHGPSHYLNSSGDRIDNSGVLFLDVDGVLNPLGPKHLGDDWRKIDVGGHRLWTSKTVGEWLNSLGCRIVWTTTWVDALDDLAVIAEAFGLSVADHVDPASISPTLRDLSCGKLGAVLDWMSRHEDVCGPYVWADDELGFHDYSFANHLHINASAPDQRMGVTDTEVRAWIESAFGPSARAMAMMRHEASKAWVTVEEWFDDIEIIPESVGDMLDALVDKPPPPPIRGGRGPGA